LRALPGLRGGAHPGGPLRPDRSQRRCAARNDDLEVRITAATARDDLFALYHRYLTHRHANGGMDDHGPHEFEQFLIGSWSHTRFMEMRLPGHDGQPSQLLGVAVTDVTEHGLSAVYTFFDPDHAARGLGTFAILQQIEWARREGCRTCIWATGSAATRRWTTSAASIRWRPTMAAAGTISTRIWTGADKPLTPGRVHNTAHEHDPPPSPDPRPGPALRRHRPCLRHVPCDDRKPSAALRLATYNTSLYSDDAGGLIKELEGDSEHARKIAAVLQQVRPDLVLLNEFDFDDAHRAADLFQKRYLEVAQPGGGKPLHFAYRYLAPVNTGVPSGLDLDNNGVVGGEGRSRGNDAWGYGLHPGQYGMLVLSRYPIDEAKVRSFQLLKWSAMPGAIRPVDPRTGQSFYNDHVWSQLRLSSKSHWDVPVKTPAGVVHALVSHPTPPVFDGPEKRNAARNHDELRLWQEYLSKGDKPWLCDDKGQCGGLAQDARFVILGDLNNDPVDGDGRHEAIVELIENARVLRYPTPRSVGGEQTSLAYAAKGIERKGAPFHATGDFGPKSGTMRLDYVLPSTGFEYVGSGIFWPANESPEAKIADGSDHHLVWVDVR
jgi:GNAT superfamily N-acetyltransferase